MKIIITLVTLCLIHITNILYSQNAYIAQDSAYTHGIDIIEGTDFSNSLICKVVQGKKEFVYTPDQLSEYRTKSGRIYISKELCIHGFSEKYFLEKIVTGDINLYYLKTKKEKIFFIEKDSSVFEILQKKDSILRKSIYKNKLKEFYRDTNAVNLSGYKKSHLKLLTERQNSNEIKPFPFSKFGILTGISAAKIYFPENYSIKVVQNLNSNNDFNFTVGAFLDIPLSLGNISFHPEIYYTQYAFSENIWNDTLIYDILVKYSSVNLPLMLRYTFPTGKIRPFANIGLMYSFQIIHDQDIYTTTYDDNIIYVNKKNYSEMISQKQIGYSGGIGLQYYLRKRNSFYFEFRYSKQFGISDFSSTQISIIHFITGFNF